MENAKKTKKTKFLYYTIATLLLLIVSAVVLSACTGQMYDVVLHKISENNLDLYVGESDNVKASFLVGDRESEYVINGFHTPVVEFGVLTFDLSEVINDIDLVEPKYTITVNTIRYDGVLEKSPIDDTYVADIKKILRSNDTIKVGFIDGDVVYNIDLEKVNYGWKLDNHDALKIACNEFKADLKTFMNNGEFEGEGYIKIINDKTDPNSDYFWYVNFVNRNGKDIAVIINPQTKEVLAKRTLS